MGTWQRRLAVVGLFVALTALATWPQVLHLGDGVRDPGDPLFNAWVLAWNAHVLGRGEIANYFDANIFYPHRRTLAYSEHLLPQSLVAAPVIWCSGNPILAHNIVLLLSLLTSALAMFALARRLTGATLPAILAGMVFAFCPFMFDHLSHVQVQGAAGFPLSFLFLDRFFTQRRRRDVLLFAGAFTAQVLANGYYALFLSLGIGFFLLIELPRRRLLGDRLVWRGLILAGILSAAIAAPFFRQYVLMQREMEFKREVMTDTTLGSYLAAPRINRLYGSLTAPLRTAEGQLFPGVTVTLLALAGAVVFVRRGGRARPVERGLVAVAGVAGLSAVGVAILGPMALPPLLSVSTPVRPAILAALALASAALVRSCSAPQAPWSSVGVFAALGLVAFTLTFGTRGPYQLLYKWVPGFDGIRAVSRVHVLTMLALAVLAAFGAAAISGPRRGVQLAVCAAAAGLVALEYVSVPIPLTKVDLAGEESRVYRWLDRAAGERDAILELPLPLDRHEWWQLECPRVLASTLHWRPLVNGYSGLAPALYHELQRRWHEQALPENVADARLLGVRFLLVHRLREGRPWPRGRTLAEALRHVPGVHLRQIFPAAWVFELERQRWAATFFEAPKLPRPWAAFTLAASVNGDNAALAADGDLRSRWATGRPQQEGDTLAVDIGGLMLVGGVRLHLGESRDDFPRGWSVALSRDGSTWHEIASGQLAELPITAYLTPADPRLDIALPPTPARFVRLMCTSNHPINYWSVHELEILAAP